MKKKVKRFNWGMLLGVLAGTIVILTGILTAMRITPPIAIEGAEVALGIWRIFAGALILFFSFYMTRNKMGGLIVALMGFFEIFVFVFEKDITILSIGPVIAIFAGIMGLMKR